MPMPKVATPEQTEMLAAARKLFNGFVEDQVIDMLESAYALVKRAQEKMNAIEGACPADYFPERVVDMTLPEVVRDLGAVVDDLQYAKRNR